MKKLRRILLIGVIFSLVISCIFLSNRVGFLTQELDDTRRQIDELNQANSKLKAEKESLDLWKDYLEREIYWDNLFTNNDKNYEISYQWGLKIFPPDDNWQCYLRDTSSQSESPITEKAVFDCHFFCPGELFASSQEINRCLEIAKHELLINQFSLTANKYKASDYENIPLVIEDGQYTKNKKRAYSLEESEDLEDYHLHKWIFSFYSPYWLNSKSNPHEQNFGEYKIEIVTAKTEENASTINEEVVNFAEEFIDKIEFVNLVSTDNPNVIQFP